MPSPPDSLLTPFLAGNGVLILDGGLASELEARGYRLNDRLWSARLLDTAPQAIQQVHADYLAAGADCIITASYQASLPGFVDHGYSHGHAVALLRTAVELALNAREAFWSKADNRPGRRWPLVAASIGPYGAYRADGSEYTGSYGLSENELRAFHRPRWQLLAASRADLLACETLPCAREARVLAGLLGETPGLPAWVSFSCRDEHRISDGTPLAEALAPFVELPQVVALGVNCTAPGAVLPLLETLRRATAKPLIVYPNCAQGYDRQARRWGASLRAADFAAAARTWRQAGAVVIGGCCRTTPGHIAALRAGLVEEPVQPCGGRTG